MISAVAENKSLLAFDAVFPQRDEILNTDAMQGNFEKILKKQIESCEIMRVKYRPEISLRAIYKLDFGSESSIFSARIFSAENFGDALEKTKNQTNIFHDENLKTVFWKFPSDRKIKNLEKIVAEGKNELVAYAPEKCATFRYFNAKNEIFAYAKIFADESEGKRTFSIYQNLQSQNAELFPKAICYSAKKQTLFVEAVEGVRVADLDEKDLPSAFELFGESIARFHNLEPTGKLENFTRHDQEKIASTLEIVKKSRPENFEQIKDLAQKLAENFDCENAPKVTLHGDVHAKNAILQANGKLKLIDLDQASVGCAASDIGSFLSGLFYKECIGEISGKKRRILAENFLAGYEKIRALPDEKSLKIYTAKAILTERCGRAINRFRVEGLKNFAAILAVSEKIINGENL